MKPTKTKKKALSKKVKKEVMWAGATRLMGKPGNQKEQQERNIINLTAQANEISPFGVNILGNLPYINKLGLDEKAKQYCPDVQYKYDWIKYCEDDQGKAICRCKLVSKGKDLCDWVVGECSPATIKMKTLTGYQNHMAQTRARNRAISETFGTRIHEEMMFNVKLLIDKKTMRQDEACVVAGSTVTSAEEAQPLNGSVGKLPPVSAPPVNKVEGIKASKSQEKEIEKYGRELGYSDPEKLYDYISKATEIKLNFNTLTQIEASKIILHLLEKSNKKNGR